MNKGILLHHYESTATIPENIYAPYVVYNTDGSVDIYDISDEDKLNNLREQRETECFPIINRGTLWYNKLTIEQQQELEIWYQAWLDVTETKSVPVKPSWL